VTWFIDLRVADAGGGVVAAVDGIQVYKWDGSRAGDVLVTPGPLYKFLDAVLNQDVLFLTHGFNVNRKDGRVELSGWEGLLSLPDGMVCIAVLWPGDSSWAHGLDYPGEGTVAITAAKRLAEFITLNMVQAASFSFASHSLGARVVLQTVAYLSGEIPVVHATLMAGAIDDDCLSDEYAAAASKIGRIAVFSSHKDEVLALAFPLGNLAAGIVTRDSPYWHAALGREGSQSNLSGRVRGSCAIPDAWEYGHHNYLPPPLPAGNAPAVLPGVNGPALPGNFDGWQAAWSACTASDRLKSVFS
jgi:hypothetical protein